VSEASADAGSGRKSARDIEPVEMTAAGMRRARAIDADTYLHKPFDVQEVGHLLRRFLGSPTKPPLDSGHGSSDPT
jgi:hypothetical protein